MSPVFSEHQSVALPDHEQVRQQVQVLSMEMIADLHNLPDDAVAGAGVDQRHEALRERFAAGIVVGAGLHPAIRLPSHQVHPHSAAVLVVRNLKIAAPAARQLP